MQEHRFSALATMHHAPGTDSLHSQLAKIHTTPSLIPPLHFKYVAFQRLNLVDTNSVLSDNSELIMSEASA